MRECPRDPGRDGWGKRDAQVARASGLWCLAAHPRSLPLPLSVIMSRAFVRVGCQRWRRRIVTAATVVLNLAVPSRAALVCLPLRWRSRPSSRHPTPDTRSLTFACLPAAINNGARPRVTAEAAPGLGCRRAVSVVRPVQQADAAGGAAQLERGEPAADGQPAGDELDSREGPHWGFTIRAFVLCCVAGVTDSPPAWRRWSSPDGLEPGARRAPAPRPSESRCSCRYGEAQSA